MGFEPIIYRETEADVQVNVCVQLFIQGDLFEPVVVTLSTQPGTAMGKPLVINIEPIYMYMHC